jgi:hypothetical protein
MKFYPDNLPPLQPWNEEKHALLNAINILRIKLMAAENALGGAIVLVKKPALPKGHVVQIKRIG